MQLIVKHGVVVATHRDEQDVRSLYPGCQIVSYDGPLPAAEPLSGPIPDPRTEEEKRTAYRDQRRQAYPLLGDQLDMIYWDRINGTKVWQDTIHSIKAQYPKPEQSLPE